VAWEDVPQEVAFNGQEGSVVLSAATEGTRRLSIAVGGEAVIRCTIRCDWTPPVVRAQLDPDTRAGELEVRRAVHEAPIGAIVAFTVADENGIDPNGVAWRVDGACLEKVLPSDAPDSAPARAWTGRARCIGPGEALVRLSGADLAGNRTTIHEYRIRVADPMDGRIVTVNGRPLPAPGTLHCSGSKLVIRTEGGIDVDGLRFVVLDPERAGSALGYVDLEPTGGGSARSGVLDLGGEARSGRRVIGILARDGSELTKGGIVLDLVPPSFRVMTLEEAGEHAGIPRFVAEPGQRVSLTVTDDVAVDADTIHALPPAKVEQVLGGDNEVGVVLLLPAIIESAIVVHGSDQAGNEAELRFEVASARPPVEGPSSAPASRPAVWATPDFGPPPPERSPSMEQLAASPKIAHPVLGTFLLVPGDSTTPPFYMSEHELAIKHWRPFVARLQSRGIVAGDGVAIDAARLLSRNASVWNKSDDDPVSGATAEMVRAYVVFANEVAPDVGVWKLPTDHRWRLAAGRALYPDCVYPTTAAFPDGGDLDGEGPRGALFGRDLASIRESPPGLAEPAAFGLRAMGGSLYEWVVDSDERLRLIGGSAVAPKSACRLDAPLRSGLEVAEYERGVRLVLLPRGP
jgi:hypothetical protein